MPKHICRFPPEGRLFQQQRRAGEGSEVAQTKLLPRHFGGHAAGQERRRDPGFALQRNAEHFG